MVRMDQPYRVLGHGSSDIAASIESQIADGRMPPGSRLPTVRALAEELGVSPATVAGAYRGLAARGLIVGRGRAGTTVAVRRSWSARSAPALPPGVLDLASGGPDPALLPDLRPALAALAQDLAPAGGRSRPYGAEAALPALRQVLARRIAAEDGPAAHGPGGPGSLGRGGTGSPEGVEIVSGVLDGLERVLSAHLRPGDVVAVEDPAYSGVLDLLDALGLVPVGVAVDGQGPLPDRLDRALRGGSVPAATAVVVTVRAQNPTGACLTRSRARDLATVLARHPHTLLVEDDHLGPIAGAELHSVAALARPASWAHLHGLAKVLGPDLRLAGLAADPVTAARVRARQQAGPGWASWLLQRLALHLLTDPGHPQLVVTAAAAYAGRREALAGALEQRGVAVHPGHGLNLWVPVPHEAAVAQSALASGVAVRPGEAYRLESGAGIRLTTAGLDPSLAAPVADILTAAITGRRAPSTP
jgi:DNA-binding transcriptional MocR family regulator